MGGERTVGVFIEGHEARVDTRSVLPHSQVSRVGVASQPIRGLVEIDMMVRVLEGPNSCQSCAAAAYDGDPLATVTSQQGTAV